MTIQDPPNWGNDPLSDFIKGAYENTFASYVRLRPAYDKLVAIDKIFRKTSECLYNSEDWFIGFFILRAHSAFLGSCRFSLSGQVYESYIVLRGCLEAASYGYLIADDAKAKKLWLDRHEDGQALREMRRAFQIRTIFELMQKKDPKLSKPIEELYERTIDLGAHPNPRGVLSSLKITKDAEHINFEMNYLTADSIQLQLALKTTAQIGIGALVLFRSVFAVRFKIVGLSDEIDRVARGL